MKRILGLIALLTSLHGTSVQAQYIGNLSLSEQANFSLITCGRGDAIYDSFGHSVIRLQDSVNQIDLVYNYGIFDFNQTNFILNYAMGELYYRMGRYGYPYFKQSYIEANRSIREQVLNLNQREKQQLFAFLEKNNLPENQNYYYDYFYDNCSTRIRDALEQVLGDDLDYNLNFIQTKYSIRQLVDLYVGNQPWGDFAIDLCLGLPIDQVAKPRTYLYLPFYLEKAFDQATVARKSNQEPLVKNTEVIYQADETKRVKAGYITPLFCFSLVLMLSAAVSFYDLYAKKVSRWFDALLFTVLGLTGTLLVFLWLFTGHQAADNNLNVLWANPLYLAALAGVVTASGKKWYRYLIAVISLCCALVAIGWFMLPQQFNFAILPLLGAVLARGHVNFWQPKKINQAAYETMG